MLSTVPRILPSVRLPPRRKLSLWFLPPIFDEVTDTTEAAFDDDRLSEKKLQSRHQNFLCFIEQVSLAFAVGILKLGCCGFYISHLDRERPPITWMLLWHVVRCLIQFIQRILAFVSSVDGRLIVFCLTLK